MPLLAAVNIRHTFGQRIVLDGVSISIEPGERVGMVGRNGCGKSTLMKILAGIVSADGGTVGLQRGSRAGYLHQDPKLDPDETLRGQAESAFRDLHEAHRQLEQVFHDMGSAEGADLERLLKQQERLERQIEALGGYSIDHKIDQVLHGLGFTDAQFGVKVSGLSGGQKGRLALAQLLLENPDILLLDEPTNHLDLDGRLWLENFLKEEFRGAVLMVSHDRYLLDNVVTRIVEVEQARLIDYPGNYEAFREIRAQRRLTMLRAYENQQTQFKKEEAYIRRYKAGQRAKQARGRATKLERAKEGTLARPIELDSFRLKLPKAPMSGEVVASVRSLTKQYALEDGKQKVLFKDLELAIMRGERWGIIGPNGAGKSTLVRCILGEQAADSGTAKLGSSVRVGHYKQTHEHVDPDLSVYEYLQRVILKEAPDQPMSEQQARNLAGAFLFSGEEQERQMGVLSGGERSRAVLAGLVASAKNVLVLDEPTNHLDIPSAERLEDALAPDSEDIEGFEGTLILISHDRALIDATCDHLLILDGKGGVEQFAGTYSDWHEREVARAKERAAKEAAERKRKDEAERARLEAEARKAAANKPKSAGGTNSQRNPLSRLSDEQLEKRIGDIEKRIKDIDAELSSEAVWKDPSRCDKLGDERQRLVVELEPLEMEWFGRSGG
ncbi:MAG: ABC-F family ATP-binding cassette domain-containing protein [Phycisphaerales bacterium]